MNGHDSVEVASSGEPGYIPNGGTSKDNMNGTSNGDGKKQTIQQGQRQSSGGSSRSSSSRRQRDNHRRTYSEELPSNGNGNGNGNYPPPDAHYQQQQQMMAGGYPGQGYPPPGYGGMPPPQTPSPRNQAQQQQQQPQQSRSSSKEGGSGTSSRRSRRGHQRSRSTPAGGHPFQQGVPAGGYDYYQQQQQQQGQAPQPPPTHRRKGSGNLPPPQNRVRSMSRDAPSPTPSMSYGSTDSLNTNLPPTHQRTSSRDFSPRGEILSLVGSSPARIRSGSFDGRGRMTPPPSPGGGYGSMSPRVSPGLNGAGGNESMRVSFSPVPPPVLPFGAEVDQNGMPIVPAGDDGIPEDLIQHRRPHHHKRSASSMRKMHMRTQSAQIFMEDTKGTPQPKACRDVLFALLFILHLVGMGYLGSTYSYEALDRDEMETVDDDESSTSVKLAYKNIIFVASLCGAVAVALSALTFVLMTIFARRVVQIGLILTIGLSFLWGTIGIGLSPKNFVPITGIIALALSVGYTFVVWDRIPFATSNLMTGLSGVRANAGAVIVSFFFQGLALLWSIYFTFVVIGVYDAIESGELELTDNMKIFVYTMLAISYYWTYHVLMNVVQVAVAGTIGDWWFRPAGTEAICDGTVLRNLFLACTLSFGSICFGSLVVGPVRFIRQLSFFIRPSTDNDSVLMGLHECLLWIQTCIANCVDGMASYFNSWAFTYVGLYGYGLLDGGSHATELFEKRGWTMIVADDLIPNVLLMVSLVIGGVTGCFGFMLETVDNLNFTNVGDPGAAAFLIGIAVGLVVCSVLFGIISSSVNAVIVCFAGNPVEFEKCHPELSQEMRAAWREVWPGCMDVTDFKVAMSQGVAGMEETIPMV